MERCTNISRSLCIRTYTPILFLSFIFIKYDGTVSWKKPGTPYVKEIIYSYIIVFHANSEFQKYIPFLLHNYILQLRNIIFCYFHHIILHNFVRSAVTKSFYLQYFNKPIERQYSVAKKA